MQLLDFGKRSRERGMGTWNSESGMEGKPNQRCSCVIKLITTVGNADVLSRNLSEEPSRMDLATVCLSNKRQEDLSLPPFPIGPGCQVPPVSRFAHYQ